MSSIIPTHRIAVICEAGRRAEAEAILDAAIRPRAIRLTHPLQRADAPGTVTHWWVTSWARADQYGAAMAPALRDYVDDDGATEVITTLTHARWHTAAQAADHLGGAYCVYATLRRGAETRHLDPDEWLASLGLEPLDDSDLEAHATELERAEAQE